MKLEVVLRPCPWCKKTPELIMPIGQAGNDERTWCWTIECRNPSCLMKPASPHVNLRKGQKKQAGQITFKLDRLRKTWNEGNPTIAYEKKIVDITELVKE
jgi:hypothetical protein